MACLLPDSDPTVAPGPKRGEKIGWEDLCHTAKEGQNIQGQRFEVRKQVLLVLSFAFVAGDLSSHPTYCSQDCTADIGMWRERSDGHLADSRPSACFHRCLDSHKTFPSLSVSKHDLCPDCPLRFPPQEHRRSFLRS